MMVSERRFQHSPMLGQDALSQTVCNPSSATRRRRSKNTSPPGILARIQGGFPPILPVAAPWPWCVPWLASTTPSLSCTTLSLRDRVSTIRSDMSAPNYIPLRGFRPDVVELRGLGRRALGPQANLRPRTSGLRPPGTSETRRPRSEALALQVEALAQCLGRGFEHRLRQGRVRMDGAQDVVGGGLRGDRQRHLGDQIRHAMTDGVHAQDLATRLVDDHLHEPLGVARSQRLAVDGEGEPTHADVEASLAGLSLGLPDRRNLWIAV